MVLTYCTAEVAGRVSCSCCISRNLWGRFILLKKIRGRRCGRISQDRLIYLLDIKIYSRGYTSRKNVFMPDKTFLRPRLTAFFTLRHNFCPGAFICLFTSQMCLYSSIGTEGLIPSPNQAKSSKH